MNISIFYEKQDSYKTIKDLTYHIGNVGVELKESSNQNREDIDIAAFTYNDAKYIRKEIQVNNEDIYFLYIYLNVFSNDKKELEYNLDKIEGILQSKGLQTRRSNFRQEQIFISCLPFEENNEDLKGDNIVYVLVSLNELEVPEYHIVPSKVVADKIKKDHANWLKTPGRNGKQHNDNSMRKFSDKEDKYLNNWEYMK